MFAKTCKKISTGMIVLLLFSMMFPVLANATTPTKIEAAAQNMSSLGLVKGVGASGDLALGANITRAQLVTILVRAFGQDANAKLLNGAAAFPDTASHPWASGYIALAKSIIEKRTNGKEVIGLPDGNFNPDGNVTAAEAIAFLMKFTGAPKVEKLSWPDNYIQGALDVGFIDTEDKAVLDGIKNTPATRGLVFYLADNAFSKVKLAEGKTVYEQFFSQSSATNVTAPTLENIHIFNNANGYDIVNVLYVDKGKVQVYDAPQGGNLLGESSEIINWKTDTENFNYISVKISDGFPLDLKAIYVELFDEKGNSAGRVEKELPPPGSH